MFFSYSCKLLNPEFRLSGGLDYDVILPENGGLDL
jgi:hypothetical protein